MKLIFQFYVFCLAVGVVFNAANYLVMGLIMGSWIPWYWPLAAKLADLLVLTFVVSVLLWWLLSEDVEVLPFDECKTR